MLRQMNDLYTLEQTVAETGLSAESIRSICSLAGCSPNAVPFLLVVKLQVLVGATMAYIRHSLSREGV